MIGRLLAVGAVGIAIAGCGVVGAGGNAPLPIGGPREDAVLVGGFGEILAVSASRRMLFVASEDGLAIHDRFTERWLPPLTATGGFPTTRFTMLSADPGRDAVWIGAVGEVLLYEPELDRLSRAIVPGRVEFIVFDRDDPSAGAFVGSGRSWTRVTPDGLAIPVRPEEIPPPGRQWRTPDLDDLYRQHPSLRAFGTLLTRDESFRAWEPSAGTRIGDLSEAWIGTLGGGLYVVDPLFNRARHVPYGLFERGASALLPTTSGVLIGSDGRDLRGSGGVTTADATLQRWEWFRGPPDGTMTGVRVNDLAIANGALWLATSRGVAWRPLGGGGTPGGSAAWRWIDDGLGTGVWSLAPSATGLWVGTDRGLSSIGSGGVSLAAPTGGSRVRALVRDGDSLWVGSDAGLLLMRGAVAAAQLVGERRTLSPTTNALDGRIRGLARADSVLVVGTDDAVVVVNLRARSASLLTGSADARTVAPIAAVAVDAQSIWIAGAGGLLVVDRRTAAGRLVRLPLPPGVPISDVVAGEELVWLATPLGVLRLIARAYR